MSTATLLRPGERCEQPWCPGEAVKARIPPSASEASRDGGYENETWLEPGSGLVKRYSRRRRFLTEQATLRLVEPLGLAPRLFAACPRHHALRMERLNGAPLRRPPDRDAAVRLASVLRHLHAVQAPRAGELSETDDLSWTTYLRRRMRERLWPLPLAPEESTRLWQYFAAGLALIGAGGNPPVLLHHDLKPANILVGGAVSPLLCDFEHARGGDARSDLGKLAWRTFAVGTSPAWADFLAAYTGGRPQDQQPVVDFYLVLHGLGALAYWHDYGHPVYFGHAREASHLVARHTGISVALCNRYQAARLRERADHG